MSQENVEFARTAVEAFNRRDIPALMALTTDDFEWITLTGGTIDSTVYKGAEGIDAYFRDTGAIWESIRVEPQEFRDLGETTVLVVSVLHARGIGSGVEVEAALCVLLRVRGDKIAAFWSFASEQEALNAAARLPE